MTEEAPAPQKRAGEGAIVFVCAAMLIDTISFGLLMPVLPPLIQELTGQTLSEASATAGWLFVTFAAFQFFAGPVMGNLSDRFGRRPILLASMAAFFVNYTLMGFAHEIALLFIGRAITGAAGAIFAPANAYVADVTPPERRAQRFALIGASFGAGFVLGPAIGGLLGGLDPRAPFFVAAGLAFLNFTLGWFVLPESLPPERRRAFDWRRANPIGALLSLRKRPEVLTIVFAIFLWNFAFQVYPATWPFFTMLQFDWGTTAIGFSLAYSGIIMVIMQGGFTGRIVRAVGERTAVVLAMISSILGMIVASAASAGWMLYLSSTIACLQGLAGPAMNAIITSRTPADQQGELQGGVASFNGLAAIFGPLVLSQTLSHFTAPDAPVHFAGAAFALAAAISLGALGVFLWATRDFRRLAPAPT